MKKKWDYSGENIVKTSKNIEENDENRLFSNDS